MPPSTNHSTRHRWNLLPTTAVICFVVSALVASAKVAFNGGFGVSDILPFLIWTLPFAGVIALTKEKLTSSLRWLSTLLGYTVAVVLGVVGGLLWTYLVAFFLGAGFGAFSFPVLPCWIAGGASAMIIGVGSYKGMRQSALIELAIIAAMCLGVVMGSKPLFVFLSGGQELEVIAIKWQPGPELLTNLEVLGINLSDRDLAQLKAIGLAGQVAYAGSGTHGEGRHARALIVMQHQLTEPINLPQPDGVKVIYIQSEDGWKMYPSDAPTLQRSIRLWADERDPTRATRYSVEHADGSRQGGTLFTW